MATKRNGKTTPAPSTALASPAPDPKLPAHLQASPPAGLPISQDEWDEMPAEERAAALAFLREEEVATTEGLTVSFPRWKFPTSGGTRFLMDTEAADAPEEKELVGVIVAKIPGRGYYEPGKPATKGTPPLCASSDGVVPDVSPSPVSGAKTCGTCPYAAWGSGRDGQGHSTRGQACKFRIRTFLLREGRPIPEYISLPPTAGKPFAQYAVALRQQRLPLIAVETILGLAKQTSGGGTEFSGLTLRMGRRLTLAEMRQARAVADSFDAHMRKIGVTVEDTTEDAGGGVSDAQEPVEF